MTLDIRNFRKKLGKRNEILMAGIQKREEKIREQRDLLDTQKTQAATTLYEVTFDEVNDFQNAAITIRENNSRGAVVVYSRKTDANG